MKSAASTAIIILTTIAIYILGGQLYSRIHTDAAWTLNQDAREFTSESRKSGMTVTQIQKAGDERFISRSERVKFWGKKDIKEIFLITISLIGGLLAPWLLKALKATIKMSIKVFSGLLSAIGSIGGGHHSPPTNTTDHQKDLHGYLDQRRENINKLNEITDKENRLDRNDPNDWKELNRLNEEKSKLNL